MPFSVSSREAYRCCCTPSGDSGHTTELLGSGPESTVDGPGVSFVLNTASTLAAQTDSDIELWRLIFAGSLGAVVGDTILYWLSRTVLRHTMATRLEQATLLWDTIGGVSWASFSCVSASPGHRLPSHEAKFYGRSPTGPNGGPTWPTSPTI